MNNSQTHFYEFGPFRLDPVEQQLWRESEEFQLTPKAFKLLLLLVENSGHILNKNELIGKVWPDTFVEENRLADNISTLRKALGDDPKAPTIFVPCLDADIVSWPKCVGSQTKRSRLLTSARPAF